MLYQCPICPSPRVETNSFVPMKTNREIVVALCKDCGYACRVDERNEQENLCLQEDFFDGDANIPDKRFIRWPRRLALVAAEVRRFTGGTGKALDVGCNNGMWLAALGSGWERHGVELSSVAAEMARRFTNAQIFCGPFESYRAEPESFGLITAFAVIEHLSNPRTLVKWACDHLKHNGLFVLMTGDRESETAVRMGAEWPLYVPDSHLSFFSARSLSHLIEMEGFQIERKEWRFMYTAQGMGSKYFRAYMRVREILRYIEIPVHDHFYLYARKI